MRKNFGTKSWFYPLPVLVIGTYDENGNPDAMNAAWGGLYDADKVVLCLSADHKTTKFSAKNDPLTIPPPASISLLMPNSRCSFSKSRVQFSRFSPANR